MERNIAQGAEGGPTFPEPTEAAKTIYAHQALMREIKAAEVAVAAARGVTNSPGSGVETPGYSPAIRRLVEVILDDRDVSRD